MDFFHVIGDYLSDSWNMLIGRSGGPFALRFILQPVIAALLGIRAGRRDARAGRPAYFWSVVRAEDQHDRRHLVRQGWSDIGKVFSIAVALDVVYEIVVFHWVYPVQALIIALVLAMVPYLIFRGFSNRIAASRRQPAAK